MPSIQQTIEQLRDLGYSEEEIQAAYPYFTIGYSEEEIQAAYPYFTNGGLTMPANLRNPEAFGRYFVVNDAQLSRLRRSYQTCTEGTLARNDGRLYRVCQDICRHHREAGVPHDGCDCYDHRAMGLHLLLQAAEQRRRRGEPEELSDGVDRTGWSYCDSCRAFGPLTEMNGRTNRNDPGSRRYRFCNTCVGHSTHCAICSQPSYPVQTVRSRDASTGRVVSSLICHECHAQAGTIMRCIGCGTEWMGTEEGQMCCWQCESQDGTTQGVTTTRGCGRKIIGKTFDELRSERFFGVELEFSVASDTKTLCKETGWGGKPDGTSGVVQEHYSPPMRGDAALESIRQFMTGAARRGYKINNSCGFHLHVDLTHENQDNIQKIAAAYAATEGVWMLMVPDDRRSNHFCAPSNWSVSKLIKCAEQDKHDPLRSPGERYRAINWAAYRRHKTVEIRLARGTVDEDKVINWVAAHVYFVDWAAQSSEDTIWELAQLQPYQRRFWAMRDVWKDDALHTFWKRRIQTLGEQIGQYEPEAWAKTVAAAAERNRIAAEKRAARRPLSGNLFTSTSNNINWGTAGTINANEPF